MIKGQNPSISIRRPIECSENPMNISLDHCFSSAKIEKTKFRILKYTFELYVSKL